MSPQVLKPYDAREAASVAEVARQTRRSPGTIRGWLSIHDLGRRVGGGVWQASKVAVAMHLDGDREALALYHAGDRQSERVTAYYHRLGIPVPKPADASSIVA